jgi:hypothetical protein
MDRLIESSLMVPYVFEYFSSSQFTANVIDVAIAIEAGLVMGAYDNYGLWIWSFGEDRPGFVHSNNSPAVADELLAKWPQNQQRHSEEYHRLHLQWMEKWPRHAHAMMILCLPGTRPREQSCGNSILRRQQFGFIRVLGRLRYRAAVIGSCAPAASGKMTATMDLSTCGGRPVNKYTLGNSSVKATNVQTTSGV